ncbi:hypothetical protein MSTE_02494 [Mycobacteroides stephanolepidis]|uniref:Integral membrane protein n=1 Tax=[Mycobacterium] stephanolepidis TaxID=1520670 RepID=A0A1Z4EXX7_9MYCO|nr:hypothetical protein [[Mycobacterium] stephanolepidis]BAX97804.1 hypothetical protein MSTE_02494 [[Mycobacterium] stephanolepidis]
MDHINRFESKTTFGLLRAEYFVGMVASGVLLLWNIDEIRWIPAIILFSWIDVVGYIPGVIAHFTRKREPLPKYYYVLYNTMHSFLTQAAVAALWVYFFGWEWALLVIPLHLCGDRALFGNFMKQFYLPFEPKALPEFVELERQVSGRSHPSGKDADYADVTQ